MDDLPLKVLLLAGRFEVRGSSAYTLRLAEHLGQYGVDAKIVCSDARAVDPEKKARLPVDEYPHLTMPAWGRIVLELMSRQLSGDVPDLIHIQSRAMLSRGTWLAKRLGRPFLLTVHDCLGPRERLRLDRRLGRQVIAVSESVKVEILARSRLTDEVVTVIHGGVDLSPNAASPLVLDPGHVPVVGTAGPLEPIKGLPFFLGAAQKVLANGRDVEFLVSGAGPEETNLRRLARKLDIVSKVTFVPRLFDFSASLAAMDIFCLPSLSQGLGTIMLEAMALGKPVIATRVGGVYSAVRDNATGLIVPPSDSRQLADRILELLGDPARARAIGEAGRQLVCQDFGVNAMVARTAQLYRDVLEKESKKMYDKSA